MKRDAVRRKMGRGREKQRRGKQKESEIGSINHERREIKEGVVREEKRTNGSRCGGKEKRR